MDFLKRMWANKYIKTAVVTAAGGAMGAVMPMIAAGTFVLNSATLSTAAGGAIAALGALWVHKPGTEPTK